MKNSYEAVTNYIAQWIDDENWDDLKVIIDACEMGCPKALEYAADHIVGTGAIDSAVCFESGKSLEKDIEALAKKFRKMPKKVRDNTYNEIFRGTVVIDCDECNHHSFVHSGNEKLYPELLKECWNCKSKDIGIHEVK